MFFSNQFNQRNVRSFLKNKTIYYWKDAYYGKFLALQTPNLEQEDPKIIQKLLKEVLDDKVIDVSKINVDLEVKLCTCLNKNK